MLTSKLKYTALLVLISSPSFVDASSSSITRPKTKSQPSCSTAFKSKDVTFCASKENILAEPAALTSTPSHVTVRGGDAEEGGLLVRLKIGFYFALWYVLNIVYNILNKKYLNQIPAPLTVGSFQFLVGSLYSILLWVTRIRPAPVLTSKGNSEVNKVGFYHMMGQELSMMSLGAGPVSFTHIVKALEPFFSAVVSAVVFGKWMHPMVYVTLIPVVGGVAYACLKERSFSWLAFWTAMGSNLAFALRAVVSKSALDAKGGDLGENLTSVNLFGIVTIFAFLQSIPLFLMGEGLSFIDLWKKALVNSSSHELVKGLVVSGLFHYLNNEVMYLALSNVHPVTLAVGNTMKRVFIVVASVLVFQNPITVQAAIGSGIGIGGVLLYSLTKQHYEEIEKKRLEEEAAAAKRKGNWFANMGKK
jgi:solute carrier family 35 protein E1